MSNGGFLAGTTAETKENPTEPSSVPAELSSVPAELSSVPVEQTSASTQPAAVEAAPASAVAEAPAPAAEMSSVVEAAPTQSDLPEIVDPELLIHEQERAAMDAAAKQEQAQQFLETAPEAAPAATGAAPSPIEATAPVQKDEVVLAVEKILEEGMDAHFKTMPEDAKLRFQQKGVEVSGRIATMLRTFKVQAKNVILLIREWLLTIPGVNKYFMEQEAKIKTDRILELDRERREKKQNAV